MALSLFSLFLLFQAAVTCCSSASRQISYNQVDHDAALRASLITLLSIGTAAGPSLQKRQERTTPGKNDPSPSASYPNQNSCPPPPPQHTPLHPKAPPSPQARPKKKASAKHPPNPPPKYPRRKNLELRRNIRKPTDSVADFIKELDDNKTTRYQLCQRQNQGYNHVFNQRLDYQQRIDYGPQQQLQPQQPRQYYLQRNDDKPNNFNKHVPRSIKPPNNYNSPKYKAPYKATTGPTIIKANANHQATVDEEWRLLVA
jgi:hypothetical protein